ncbi:hypothetical protein BCAL_1069 [Bifidobacterium callitrichos DSM 23973]|uniref:Uncharacterized protein n=2 Tax=Bifidobacterium callitrichos TaxID=762209 RepID=A0A086ZXT9_9BIFI|nr:hypothetical protein BCAL_1069 [Bifidobacterium callitrichos DSM 23973]
MMNGKSYGSRLIWGPVVALIVLVAFVGISYIWQTSREVTGKTIEREMLSLSADASDGRLRELGYLSSSEADSTNAVANFIDDVNANRQSVLRMIEDDSSGDGPKVRVLMFDLYQEDLGGVTTSDHAVTVSKASGPGQIREWIYDCSTRQWVTYDKRFSRDMRVRVEDGRHVVDLVNIPSHYPIDSKWKGSDERLTYS